MIAPMIHRNFAILFLFLAPAFEVLAEPATPPPPSLEEILVEAYQGWRTSMLEGDYPSWQKHTSNYRRAVTRNNIVSQKQKFPGALFAVPIKPASIDGMRPIQARAVGRTAQLVYFGKIDVGLELPEGSELPENLLILKFIKDGRTWKFNTLSILNLNGAAEIREQIAKRDYAFLNVGNFVPPGFVPGVPPECPFPDYVAQIQITSFGYDTVVTINGESIHKVSDNASSGLIIGGLVNGPNRVVITSKPSKIPESDDPEENEIPDKLEVSVFALPNNNGTKAHRSWHYEPKKVLPSYRGMFFAMPR